MKYKKKKKKKKNEARLQGSARLVNKQQMHKRNKRTKESLKSEGGI